MHHECMMAISSFITSAGKTMFVCLPVGLPEKKTDLHETLRRGVSRAKEQWIRFWG